MKDLIAYDRTFKEAATSFLRQSFKTSGALQLLGHIDSNATPLKKDRDTKGIECQSAVRLAPCISVGFGFSGDARGRRDLSNIRSLIGGFVVDSSRGVIATANSDDDAGHALN